MHANDVAEVISWTHRNVANVCPSADPAKIVLLGHSAGGHLASIVSTNHKYLRRVNLPLSVIKCTVCISGVFSDRRMQQSVLGSEILKNAFGDRKSYVDAFPIYHAQPTSPPHLLLNASVDYSLKRHTRDFFMALREQGVYVESHVYPMTTHFSIRHGWTGQNTAVLNDITAFIREQLPTA